MPVWYQFYAPETGILTVNATSADATVFVCAVMGREISGEGTVSMPVVKDRVYYIGVVDYTAPEAVVDITFSASIEAGDIVTDGTANVPHNIVLGENTAIIVDGDVVFFAYKFTSAGTLTLTTESPIISAALTFVIFLAVMFLGSYAGAINSTLLQSVAGAISFIDRFTNFTTGVLDLTDIIYMVSVSAFFIFLTARSVEKRRWA